MLVNQTCYAATFELAKDPRGGWQAIVAIKATYGWTSGGHLEAQAPVPWALKDEYAGDPEKSGLLRASELGPCRPRVDILLVGSVTFPRPVAWADVGLAVGRRLTKAVRVYGERHWTQGIMATAVPSEASPTAAVPIAWERVFGGADGVSAREIEPRNPVGTGVSAHADRLLGQAAPQFESASQRIASSAERPAPCGLGPVAPHWQPRAGFAGTYDDRWAAERAPLLPLDFNPLFFNAAPADQQLDEYVPGELLRLVNLCEGRTFDLTLPSFDIPVLVASDQSLAEDIARVDLIVLEPDRRRLSLVARAAFDLDEDPSSLRQIVVGAASKGMQKALATGRDHPAFARARGAGADR